MTPRSRSLLALAFILLLFGCLAVNQWSLKPPVGSDGDEYLLVAKTFLRTGHFSVGDVHATKYPPLTSSIAAVFYSLKLNVPFAMIALNYLAILASALVLFALLRHDRPVIASVLALAYLLSSTALWVAASEIAADAFLFLLVSLALLLALKVDAWTPRQTLLAALLALLAVMCKGVGLVVICPLAASLIYSHLRRSRPFPYAKLALLVLLPICALALDTASQARFDPHPTGYANSFLMNDPFDASRGRLTPLSFLWRTARGALTSLGDLRQLTIPSTSGPFAWAAALHPALGWLLASSALLLLFLFALGRDRKTTLVVASFLLPFLAVVSAWPYKGTRFVLPLLALAALGLAGLLTAALRSRHRLLATLPLVLLLLSQVTFNLIDLDREARERTRVRTHLNADIGEIVWWLGANVPEDEPLASPDYREIMLRLDRPVVPLAYSLDSRANLARLHRAHARWLVYCLHVYPLREVYARHLVTALGDRAALEYSNDSFLVYRLRPDRPTDDSTTPAPPARESDADP